MRVSAYLAAVLLLLCGAAACSSSTSTADESGSNAGTGKFMPGVAGKKLNVAEDAIERAGGNPDKIKLLGGGRFGVVVKSNWTVCSQQPKAGEALPDVPQLTIERNCSNPSTASSAPTSAPADPSASAAAPLTADTSKEFAALLKVGDGCDESVQSFANEYEGKQIEFDGSISALSPHDGATTRYDISIGAGDMGGNTSVGPNFQFSDVNTTSDLNYEGNVPNSITVGTKLHLVAEVGEYADSSCLLQLTPISTRVR